MTCNDLSRESFLEELTAFFSCLAYYGYLSDGLGAVWSFFLPLRSLSKLEGSINGSGNSGCFWGGVAWLTGSTIVGVTNTSNSVSALLMLCERKSCPRIGMSPIPGILLICAVVR